MFGSTPKKNFFCAHKFYRPKFIHCMIGQNTCKFNFMSGYRFFLRSGAQAAYRSWHISSKDQTTKGRVHVYLAEETTSLAQRSFFFRKLRCLHYNIESMAHF